MENNNIFKDAESLYNSSFDMTTGTIYYPVRHHSPACAFHLKNAIEIYNPDVILIEGPSDADSLIPYLANDETVPPVCIYYSYDDKKGLIDESKEKYRAYYPFLEYSPEMLAIKQAGEKGIETHFIDMPYSLMLVNGERRELQFDFGKDDYENERAYTEIIAENNGCRSFSEFWESRFETSAMYKSTEEFVKGVMALGFYMRECGHKDESEWKQNAYREKCMADNIAKYQKTHKKILVVAGAYHIAGLLSPQPKLPKLKKDDTSSKNLYLMPYSFFEMDSKSGYGAGIPFPSFYQKIWKRFTDGKSDIFKAYEETVLEYIVKTARYTRSKQPVSVPDEVNAFAMAKSLAQLREKSSAGVYELIDGVRSTFVKGDISTTAVFELDFLFRQLTGTQAGKISADIKIIPPVIDEFHQICKKYRIKTNSIAYQDITLETVKKQAHYEKSCFLHKMEFLKTGFCKMLAGADYITGKDRNLIREQWRCRYSSSVETVLIDLSVYGDSISQICKSLVDRQFSDNFTASELGKLMVHIHIMGMNEIYDERKNEIKTVIVSDNDFISVCSLISRIKSVLVMNKLRSGEVPESLNEYLAYAYSKAVTLIDSIKNADDDKQDNVCKGIKQLYSISLEYPEICPSDVLCEEITNAYNSSECKSQIYGVCMAVLFKLGEITSEDYGTAVNSYLETADGEESALFLCGTFMAGRDIVFTDKRLLMQIDKVISSMDKDNFIKILPNLRYAFTNFIPSETKRISSIISGHYGVSADMLEGSIKYSSSEVTNASYIDKKAVDNMKKWGLL